MNESVRAILEEGDRNIEFCKRAGRKNSGLVALCRCCLIHNLCDSKKDRNRIHKGIRAAIDNGEQILKWEEKT